MFEVTDQVRGRAAGSTCERLRLGDLGFAQETKQAGSVEVGLYFFERSSSGPNEAGEVSRMIATESLGDVAMRGIAGVSNLVAILEVT